ncbi:MAG: antibiotic biosynthesis monooxygenase [Actinomycetota bacterium]|nr:antibiotic biosynthesis monooxygenase [Actinomycetota bacterium]
MDAIATTPDPPYFAVIFTSQRHAVPGDGYDDAAARMIDLAQAQPGFLGVESAHEELGLTISYWTDLDAIAGWKAQADHVQAQAEGRARWYEQYSLRIALVEREYGFRRGG